LQPLAYLDALIDNYLRGVLLREPAHPAPTENAL